MIRFLKLLLLALIAVALLVVALANRQIVTLSLLTPELVELTGVESQVDLPLYFVGFGGVAIGLMIGFILEWLRETKHRREVTKRQKQVRALKQEVNRLRGEKNAGKDEVLALLEDSQKKAG
jgi:uncharacterized integral membrane protein